MLRIAYVTISGMHNVTEKTYKFNQLNYLHGQNGAGKSTAMQAVQLGLLGYIPGTAKTTDAIFKHCKKGVMTVEVGLTDGANNITVYRNWHGKEGYVHSGVSVSPDGYDLPAVLADLELPIFNFGTEFIGMSANKLKDWFVGFLPNADANIDWEVELKQAAKLPKSSETLPIADPDLIPTMLQKIQKTPGTGVDHVRNVNAMIKDMISFKKAEIARMTGTIQQLVHYDDTDMNVDENQVRSRIRELQLQSRIVQDWRSATEHNEKVDAALKELEHLEGEFEDNEEVLGLQNRQSALSNEQESKTRRLWEIRDKISELEGKKAGLMGVIRSGGVCQYTNTVCDTIVAKIQGLQHECDGIDSDLAVLKDAFNKIKCELDAINAERTDISNKLATIKGLYDKQRYLLNHYRVIPSIDAEWIQLDYESEIDNLTQLCTKAGANRQYEAMMATLTNEKFIADNTLTLLKLWDTLTGMNGLQTRLMNEPFQLLARNIDKYVRTMFGGDVATHFHLSEKANSFSFGILRNEKYIPFDLLSSGERCMFTLALMCCIVDSSKSDLKLIMIDDLLDHLDDSNINKVFDALKKIDVIQFILAGVKPCTVDGSEAIVIPVNSQNS